MSIKVDPMQTGKFHVTQQLTWAKDYQSNSLLASKKLRELHRVLPKENLGLQLHRSKDGRSQEQEVSQLHPNDKTTALTAQRRNVAGIQIEHHPWAKEAPEWIANKIPQIPQ